LVGEISALLKAELEPLKTTIARLKTELAGVKSDLVGVNSDLVGVKSDLDGVNSDLVGVKSDVGLMTRLEAMNAKLEVIALQRRPPPEFLAFASSGEIIERVLRHISGGWTTVDRGLVGEAVITPAQQARLSRCTSEAEIAACVTPSLQQLCIANNDADDLCPMVLVNGKRYRWLQVDADGGRGDYDLNPHLWASWKPFVHFTDDACTQGILGGAALQQTGGIAGFAEAAGVPVTSEAFGKLVAYHACVGTATCHGMLFNKDAFVLLLTVGGHPVKRIDGKLTQAGSAKVIRDFFKGVEAPPLVQALRLLLAKLKTSCLHVDGRCYLGSGAHGHVFTVAGPAGAAPRALKVVLSNLANRHRLATEFACMEAAKAAGAPVVRVVASSLHTRKMGDDAFASGYLLEDVGTGVDPRVGRTSKTTITKAFQALAALHLKRVIHGDARLANLVIVGGAYKWIDLCFAVQPAAEDAFTSAALLEATHLARSVLVLRSTEPLPDAVAAAVAEYDPADVDSTTAIVTALWAIVDSIKLPPPAAFPAPASSVDDTGAATAAAALVGGAGTKGTKGKKPTRGGTAGRS